MKMPILFKIRPFISLISGLLLTSPLWAVVPADSKILFLGSGAAEFQATFQSIYESDTNVSSLNLQFSHFDDDDILQAYYDDRVVAADKNPMLDAIDASGDYIILIPREDDIERKPALFMETVRLIKAYTAKRDSKIIVPMIWDSGTFSSSLSYVEEVSYRVTDALALDCVPAGLVMEDVVNDTLISATASSVQSPNKWVEYVMAVSVYTHLFEQDAHNSTYTHEDITAEQTTQIIDYAYSNWDEAQTATHYTGEFTSSFCTPFEVPLLLADMRNWASMGTSTEKGTTRQLRKIMKNTGYGDLGKIGRAHV